jgi:PhnB protein
MKGLNPYLNFSGTTEAAFNFYKSVFGGEFLMVSRFKDAPEADKLSEEDRNKIMHIALPVGKNILMATDSCESMGQHVTPGTNVTISVDPDSLEEARAIFEKLSQKGKVQTPFEKMFWGGYFGKLTDDFGVQWMINFQETQGNPAS